MNKYRVRIAGQPDTAQTIEDRDSIRAAERFGWLYGARHQWPAVLLLEVEDYDGGPWLPFELARHVAAYYQASVPAELIEVRGPR